jgi:hypothetical protein
MNPEPLLRALRERGITLSLRSGATLQLIAHPASDLSEFDQRLLRRHKAALMALILVERIAADLDNLRAFGAAQGERFEAEALALSHDADALIGLHNRVLDALLAARIGAELERIAGYKSEVAEVAL